MKYKHMVILGVSLLIASCVAVEPTRVENGLYINPAYQFSLQVPSGWKTSDEIPELLKKNMPVGSRQNFKATFSDFDNKRFILLSAEKTEADWLNFKMYSDEFIKSLDKVFAREKKKFLINKKSNYYHYKIFQSQIEKCDKDCIATKIDFGIEDLKASGHNIIYKSNSKKLYSIALILITREQQYDDSLKVFKRMVNSFEHLP